MIGVQVDGVWGYDEDHIALIIPDFSNFAVRVPIILGTPTIGQVVNVMREMEVDASAMLWVNARVAHLLAIRRMAPVEVGDTHEKGYDTNQDSFRDVYPESRNIGTFFIPCNTCEDERSILGRMA